MVIAKFILPWYGGVPAVWTTAMLFFQCLLLGGYAYAHWLTGRTGAMQRRLHLLLLGASLAALLAGALAWGSPLLPSASWKPLGDEEPVWHIVVLLAGSVGAPFFVLSATAPLVQTWFSRTRGSPPWRLYALSNLGSLLGLLTYPFLVEVFVPLRLQATAWAVGYVLFAGGVGYIAFRHATAGETPARVRPRGAAEPVPGAGTRVLWFALAACASVLLLAVTNQLSQEIAVVPLLWVLPLSLYLLSFVLCFDGDRWYARPVYLALLVPALALATLALQHGVHGEMLSQLVLYSGALFVACMVCHGELARLKPAPRHLTAFYLTVTAGGAAGGVFVALIAPALFSGYWELSLGLWSCAALAIVALWRDPVPAPPRTGNAASHLALFGAVLLATLVFSDLLRTAAQNAMSHPLALGASTAAALGAGLLYAQARGAAALGPGFARATVRLESLLSRGARSRMPALWVALAVFGAIHLAFALESRHLPIAASRNFFGVFQVFAEEGEDGDIVLALRHGRTVHGMQSLAAQRRAEPNTYYTAASGIALALRRHPRRREGLPLRIGVVGLGTGTLAAYGRAGDYLRFYEINPAVASLAGAREGALFTFLRDTPAAVSVVLGDARLALERELRKGRPQGFDVLVLDAFNSGSIPVHLLTREAVALYVRHLEPENGVIALHVSNRYLDLRPLVAALAGELGLSHAISHHDDRGLWSSTWAFLARRPEALPVPPGPAPARLATAWRDDHSNLLPLLRGRPAPGGAAQSLTTLESEAIALDPAR
ncbi:membrane protein [Sulfurifustis variabilis]|uniref:Membrane protein n=1 Tax=Sulfurifustis variabilis TaxID=1675686 RepID=A0A1B4V6Z2_9GAMM|nr:fused MFS/spermidine synthase [Sulfurifustis variabilis]BAU49303.1 membrane protein [Sulfurifustis variabilis]